jgi:ABC-type multidrug transport system fused ATPase/permease subunit
MSEGGFHVHGPHDHHLEHAARHGEADAFSGRVAVTTAVLATVGALMAYQGGATQANAALFKNNAAIKKTEASNQWNYYQAKSSKQNLAELAQALVSTADKQEFYKQEGARYDKEKKEIKAVAEKQEAESREWDQKSDEQLHQHHRWAQATTALQIAIAMSAIALLTRRTWLLWGVYGVGALGAALGILALAHI